MIGLLTRLLGPRLQEEQRFQSWYGPMARGLGIDPNPDAPEHHYDYRALFNDAGPTGPERGHFPSTYKLPGHPRTYLQDGNGRVFDTRSATYLDGSPVPEDRLRASERMPDMPGYVPPVSPGQSLFQEYLERMDQPAPQLAPMRDPMQAGPSPPVNRPFAAMLGGR